MVLAELGANQVNEGIFALFSGAMGFVYLVFFLIMIASLWAIYAKAGKPGWAAIVPIYNIWVWIEIVGKPWWWILLLLIPLVNIVIYLILLYDLAQVFGHGLGFFLGMWFLPIIFYPILGWGSSKYLGPQAA